MTRTSAVDSLWLKVLVGIALLGVAAWFVNATEWVEDVEKLPMRGEAAKKSSYAAAQLLRRIGAQVVERDNLDELPPPGATLVLDSNFWSMFPERVERLHAWVARQGGHLVVPRYLVRPDELGGWLPIKFQARPPPSKEQVAEALEAASSASAAVRPDDPRDEDPVEVHDELTPPLAHRIGPATRAFAASCTLRHEPAERPATFAGHRDYRICGGGAEQFIVKPELVEWSLNARHGPKTARVTVGRGSVLVFDNSQMFDNRGLLNGDNALAFLAGLRLPVGEQVWFVADETRPPLLEWLWQRGAVVITLGGLALAAALWRNGARFGPLAAAAAAGRRSVSEQIRGTAEFVWHRGPRALHAAQLRALDEIAIRQLRGYARLERSAKAAALARATGFDADDIARALDGRIDRPRAAWPPVLALLESVRRQLLAARTG